MVDGGEVRAGTAQRRPEVGRHRLGQHALGQLAGVGRGQLHGAGHGRGRHRRRWRGRRWRGRRGRRGGRGAGLCRCDGRAARRSRCLVVWHAAARYAVARRAAPVGGEGHAGGVQDHRGCRRRATAHQRRRGGRRHQRGHRADADEAAAEHQPPPGLGRQPAGVPDGVLEEAVGHGRHADRGQHDGQALPRAQRAELGRDQHEGGPVPQVDAVGALADPLERSPAEQGRRTGAQGRTRGHDRGGGQHGQRGGDAGEGGGVAEGHRRDDHGDEARPTEQGPDRAGDPQELRGQEGQPGTGQQLPGAGGQAVERPRLVPRRQPHAGRQRDRPEHRDQPRHRRSVAAPVAGDEQQEDRPHQVELLLHRERPEVEQRRRCQVGGQVVALLVGEDDVHDEGGCREAVARQVELRQRCQHEGAGHEGGDDDEARGRQEPAGAPGPEAAEAETTGHTELADQQRGDEEAGEDEEHVDADVAATEGAEIGVVRQDEQDRERSQPLDVAAEAGRVATEVSGVGEHERGCWSCRPRDDHPPRIGRRQQGGRAQARRLSRSRQGRRQADAGSPSLFHATTVPTR